jgi:hypothetical protein
MLIATHSEFGLYTKLERDRHRRGELTPPATRRSMIRRAICASAKMSVKERSDTLSGVSDFGLMILTIAG